MALSVKGLSKAFKVYQPRFRRILEWLLPWSGVMHSKTWVINNVSFTLNSGESLGILGVNGAGKSTLLKMIAGTLKPTSGRIEVEGRVTALLELGMGFHPEFTGRQNVFLAAQLFGYDNEVIQGLIPKIYEFSELGDYFDQPIRVYSSGMQVRLAFSVATAVRPDVLIVDEALSVGDIYFQQKCLSLIGEFKKQGTSLLFVTHDLSTLHAVCDRALVLVDGQVRFDGPTADAVEHFYAWQSGVAGVAADAPEKGFEGSFPIDDVRNYIESFDVIEPGGGSVRVLVEGKKYFFRLRLKNLASIKDPHFGFRIQDRLGNVMYETNTYCQGVVVEEFVKNNAFSDFEIEITNNLSSGQYTLAFGIEAGGHGDGCFDQVVCITRRIFSFDVIRNHSGKKWAGKCNLEPAIRVMKKNDLL